MKTWIELSANLNASRGALYLIIAPPYRKRLGIAYHRTPTLLRAAINNPGLGSEASD